MKALHVFKYGRFPQIIQLPFPKLQADQFLIRMKNAPINPSDINFFQGFYGIRKSGTPIVGFEGSGVIIQSQNLKSKDLVGRSVSVLANKSNGTFATHIASSEQEIILWPNQQKYKQSSLGQISMAWINPVSCVGLSNYIPAHNFETVVISAATSQLSKMLIRFIKKQYPSVNIIGFSRSQKQDQQLVQLGLSQILRTTDIEAVQKLREREQKCLFLDCIGGDFASRTFNSLPAHSLMVSYGRLSRQPLNNIDLGELYFRDKKIQGFWMNTFLTQLSPSQLMDIKKMIVQHYQQIFTQVVRTQHPMEEYLEAMKQSVKNASQGKILLAF